MKNSSQIVGGGGRLYHAGVNMLGGRVPLGTVESIASGIVPLRSQLTFDRVDVYPLATVPDEKDTLLCEVFLDKPVSTVSKKCSVPIELG